MTDRSNAISEPSQAIRWAIRAVVVLPIVVAAARALATGWFPVGDNALLAVRAYDVGTAHHPLLGSWTSASLTLGEDVNNPGPLYPDVLAPFMWTIGGWFGIGAGVAVGVATVNSGFALATGWVGGRIGGWRVERWGLLLAAALSWSLGSQLLIDIWQPHALMLPFACLLMLTVALVDGHWRLAPVWLGVASLIVQTHIGYVYVASALGLVIVGRGVVAARAAGWSVSDVIRHRTTAWCAGVLALAWIQPVIEQIFGEGRGNLARLASNAGGGNVTLGAGTALKLVAQVVALPPWWTRAGFVDSVTSTPLTGPTDAQVLAVPGLPSGLVAVVALAIVLGVLGWLAWTLHRRDRNAAAAASFVSAVGVVTAVATLTIQTVSAVGLGSHHVRWLWVLSLFVQISILWGIVDLTAASRSARSARSNQIIDAAVLGGIAVFAVANLGFTAHDVGPTADRAATDTLEKTFDDLADFEPGGAVHYDVSNVRPFEPWSAAVKMRLRELGIEFRLDEGGITRQYGNARRADGSEVTTMRQIERSPSLRYDGPGCIVSTASPFDADTEAQIDADIDAAAADIAGGLVVFDLGGLDADLSARFERALEGDEDEAFVLVADGVVAFLAADGRIVTSSAAIDTVVVTASTIAQRVSGALILVTDPPVGCAEH